jgi:Xaa-Pro dipeptidase
MTDERYFSLDEYRVRWAKVGAEMVRRGFERALIWGKSAGTYERSMDVLYLTNFYSSLSGQEPDSSAWNARSFCCVIVERGREPEIIHGEVNPRPERLATQNQHHHMDPIAGLAETLKARGASGPVAFVGADTLPVKYARQLEAATPEIDYVYEDDLVARVRRIKSEAELELFREGAQIADTALIALMEAMIAGRSEAEAASAAVRELFVRGGYFQRIAIAHGETTNFLESTPMHGFSTTRPSPGDLFHADILGPPREGYWLDPARTAVVGGKPSAEQRRLIEDCNRIMTEGIEANVKAGVRIKAVAEATRKFRDEIGGDFSEFDANWPQFGHSNGCMWEAPYISLVATGDDEVFEENMVFGGETFLSRDGLGTAEVENNWIVTKDGIELLTKTPLEWW